MSPKAEYAVRARITGEVQGVGLREATVARASTLGVLGWIRHGPDGDALLHAEGVREDVESLLGFLRAGPADARVEGVEAEPVKPEGHEQFAIRGVSAGAFALIEDPGAGRFELQLEVGDAIRAWALPKRPSMDPAVKRMAIELPARATAGAELTGGAAGHWDQGDYEQGGRVPWPEAIERGHAVFVLHGERLSGGFALQRTRGGARPGWLLIKRRDEDALPGSDVVADAAGA